MGAVSAMILALGGCQTISDLNPLNLYHGLEGGAIADARPPPPNADAPYPNIAETPDKPTDADAALRARVASGLVADRANAQYEASVSPLPPPASGPPVNRGAPPPVEPDPDTPSASLQAANAPPPAAPAAPAAPAPPAPFGPSPDGTPPPAPPAAPAPVPAPSAAPAPPLKAAPARPVASSPLAPAAPPVASATPPADSGALPDMPASPPGPPSLPGANVPRVTAPTPPPTPPTPLPPPSAPAGAIPIAFARGSSALPPAAIGPLQAVARRRGVGSIGVTGFGEAAGTDPAAQSAAVPLGFARARAIASQLEAAGVPANAIRLDAEALGNGAAVRVLP